MNFLLKKVLYGFLLLGGTLIALTPFLIAAITGDEAIVKNDAVVFQMFLSGLVMVIASSIFSKRAFKCPSCGNRMTTRRGGTAGTYAGGLLGTFRILKLRNCPVCGAELYGGNR